MKPEGTDASGTVQVIVGDLWHVSQPTACRAMHRVSASLLRKIMIV